MQAVAARPETALCEQPVLAFIGLGSNQGDREAYLTAAVEAIAALPGSRLLAVSALYASAAAEGATGSGDFLNAALALETRLPPHDLLDALQAIEQAGGRERPYHHAPRTLDLDILLYGDAVIDDGPRLLVPHPRLSQRDFVLLPLMALRATLGEQQPELRFLGQLQHPLPILGNSCEIYRQKWKGQTAL